MDIDQYSLCGRVFYKIREDILNGKYKDNEELKEIAIGKELGVSRTPVREAFRQLELEGLIHIVPNKGAYVTGITAKDVKDIYMIRSKLEGLCALWATEYITKEQMEELEENIYLSKFHSEKGHSEQNTELDNRFHEILYDACNSKMLKNQLLAFHNYVLRVRRKTLSDHKRSAQSVKEHEAIFLAIKNNKAEEAERLANQHVLNAFKNIVAHGLYDVYDDEESAEENMNNEVQK